MVAKVRERLAVSKQEVQNLLLEIGKQYQIKISNTSTPLENLNASEDLKRAWKNTQENMKTTATESRSV